MATDGQKLSSWTSEEECERERKREAIRARIAAMKAAESEAGASTVTGSAASMPKQHMSIEEEEKERKREAIRQRIAAQKAAEHEEREAEERRIANAASRDRDNGELEYLTEKMVKADIISDAHTSDELPLSEVAANGAQDTGNPYALAGNAEFDAWGEPVYTALPLPTLEAGVDDGVTYKTFEDEVEMEAIVALIDKDLSEPYSILTYRYFIYNWSQHTHMAMYKGKCCGVVVCKLEQHRDYFRGYIAMLAVDEVLRGKGIGSCLVSKAIQSMRSEGCEEVVLETECSNTGALSLYEKLGFFRDKRLLRYYLNGGDAFRLKLWFPGVAYYT